MKNEGFLLIDHQASPGLTPADFRKAGITGAYLRSLGLDPAEFGPGKRLERATRRCCHCGNQVFLNPQRVRERYFCRTCPKGHDYVCDRPECHYDCAPFRKKVEKLLEERIKAEQLARVYGNPPTLVTVNLPDKDDPAPSIIKD
jgi:hypothetical protein